MIKRRIIFTLKGDEKSNKKLYPKVDQFATELDYFSNCVLNNQTPEPSAVEGRADVRVIEAILKSIKTGQPVKMALSNGPIHPEPNQNIIKSPVTKLPKMVKVKSPH